MAKEDNVSVTPMKPYDGSISRQSTKRSVFDLRGLRRSKSASGASYTRIVAGAKSVEQLEEY